jgi:hypothetical protein
LETITVAEPQAADLVLKPNEREILLAEIAAFAARLSEPASRARYRQLGAAVEDGSVPPELIRFLETLLELLLPTQRIRREHGPEADRALSALFYRTPRGAALKTSADEVNRALTALQGQKLEGLSFTPSPSGQTLAIDTAQCRLTLKIDRTGVRVERVEVGA